MSDQDSHQTDRPSINSTVHHDEDLPSHSSLDNDQKPHVNEKLRPAEPNNVAAYDPKALEAGISDDHENEPNEPDVTIVGWDGPEDVMNPKNWSKKKKWAATAVVSSYTFISPIASSMIAPAAASLAHDLHITNSAILSMTVSIFILAYAFGPLLLGPLSEIYGRAHVLQLANLFFLVFNIACGFANNTGEFLAFRLLAGFGGSAPLAIGGGVLGDCWTAEERGQAVAIYSLAPLLGPVIGPIAGAWIAEKSTWRWVFWSSSMACGVVQIMGLFFLRETFAPVLLEEKAKRIRKNMGIGPEDQHRVRTEYETPDRHWQKIFAKALVRPFVMFAYEPIIQMLGIYMAFMYVNISVMPLVILVTLPDIFQNTYHQPVGIAGLHYLALGIGLSGASQINARTLDRVYKYYKAKNGGAGRPEYRLPSMFVGVAILPIGLLIAGWGAQEHVFWILPDIGIMLIGAGMILIFQSVQTYVIDTFTLHAASALGAVSFLRSLAGFGFPLFAPAMYNALGYGKGDTILAAFAIGIGCPAPFIFWYYGERIRQRSRYTHKNP
ncbi:MFS polyamine transporter [Ramaria rubella]|nr:MFS polyamine transporter [Ramaria rubella]